jgi:leucyl aminopeptidase
MAFAQSGSQPSLTTPLTTSVRTTTNEYLRVLTMFGFAFYNRLLFLLLALRFGLCLPSLETQLVLTPPQEAEYSAEEAIFAALEEHSDPVAAYVSLQPDIESELAQPRLLHVVGEQKPEWMTEGDKLRLRRRGKKFMDITDHHSFYEQQVDAWAGKACLSTSAIWS